MLKALGDSHENRSFRIIQSAYKFLAGLLCFSFSAINQSHKNSVNMPKQTRHIIFSYLMNFNLVNDQHSALEISDLSELTVHLSGTVAKTASNIHILHNHNLGWVLSYSKSVKAM
jgi:hypothetical protein